MTQIPPRASASDLFVPNRKPLKSTGHLLSLAPQTESMSSLQRTGGLCPREERSRLFMAAPAIVYSSPNTQSSQTQPQVFCLGSLYPVGAGSTHGHTCWQVDRCVAPLCACAARFFRVSVSVVLSIMQTLNLTPEPSLSLPLNMHLFPSPGSLSPPTSHKPSLRLTHQEHA